MNLDMTKLEPLLGTVVNEIGAASNAALVILGDKLGLFRALAERAMTPSQLAEKTGTHERYVREWLSAQAASGFVTYDKEKHTFSMTPEQAAVFAHRGQPGVHDRRLLSAVGGLSRRAEARRGVQERQGPALGRALQLPVLRRRALLPPRLSREPGRRVAAGARRRGREARARRQGRRRRLRPRRLDHPDGAGVPEVAVRRHRLPRWLDRACQSRRRRA